MHKPITLKSHEIRSTYRNPVIYFGKNPYTIKPIPKTYKNTNCSRTMDDLNKKLLSNNQDNPHESNKEFLTEKNENVPKIEKYSKLNHPDQPPELISAHQEHKNELKSGTYHIKKNDESGSTESTEETSSCTSVSSGFYTVLPKAENKDIKIVNKVFGRQNNNYYGNTFVKNESTDSEVSSNSCNDHNCYKSDVLVCHEKKVKCHSFITKNSGNHYPRCKITKFRCKKHSYCTAKKCICKEKDEVCRKDTKCGSDTAIAPLDDIKTGKSVEKFEQPTTSKNIKKSSNLNNIEEKITIGHFHCSRNTNYNKQKQTVESTLSEKKTESHELRKGDHTVTKRRNNHDANHSYRKNGNKEKEVFESSAVVTKLIVKKNQPLNQTLEEPTVKEQETFNIKDPKTIKQRKHCHCSRRNHNIRDNDAIKMSTSDKNSKSPQFNHYEQKPISKHCHCTKTRDRSTQEDQIQKEGLKSKVYDVFNCQTINTSNYGGNYKINKELFISDDVNITNNKLNNTGILSTELIENLLLKCFNFASKRNKPARHTRIKQTDRIKRQYKSSKTNYLKYSSRCSKNYSQENTTIKTDSNTLQDDKILLQPILNYDNYNDDENVIISSKMEHDHHVIVTKPLIHMQDNGHAVTVQTHEITQIESSKVKNNEEMISLSFNDHVIHQENNDKLNQGDRDKCHHASKVEPCIEKTSNKNQAKISEQLTTKNNNDKLPTRDNNENIQSGPDEQIKKRINMKRNDKLLHKQMIYLQKFQNHYIIIKNPLKDKNNNSHLIVVKSCETTQKESTKAKSNEEITSLPLNNFLKEQNNQGNNCHKCNQITNNEPDTKASSKINLTPSSKQVMDVENKVTMVTDVSSVKSEPYQQIKSCGKIIILIVEEPSCKTGCCYRVYRQCTMHGTTIEANRFTSHCINAKPEPIYPVSDKSSNISCQLREKLKEDWSEIIYLKEEAIKKSTEIQQFYKLHKLSQSDKLCPGDGDANDIQIKKSN